MATVELAAGELCHFAKLAGLVPDATLVTIERAGHAVHRTRPAEFLAAVRPFLQHIR